MTSSRTFLGYRGADWRVGLVLSGLIVGQTVSGLLVVSVLPTIYRQQGLELSSFWMFSLAAVPVWFKWAWAPLVDRHGWRRLGRRRSWIFPTTLVSAAVYFALMALEPSLEALPIVVAVLLLQGVVLATQDIAVDGYCVEALDDRNRGLGAGILNVADSVGYVVALWCLLGVYDHFGWRAALALAALLLVALMLPAILRPEPRPVVPVDASRRPSLRGLLRRPETPAVMVVVFGAGVAANALWALFGPYLVDRRLSLTDIGFALGVAAAIAALVGTLVSVPLLRRLGERRTMWVGLVCTSASLLPLLALHATREPTWLDAMLAFGTTQLLLMPMWTVVFAARLRWASPEQAGTDFTVQSSVRYVGYTAIGAASGPLAEAIGWNAYFAVATLAGVLVCVLYLLLQPGIERRRARATAGSSAGSGESGAMPADAASHAAWYADGATVKR